MKMTLEKYFNTVMNLKKIRRLMKKFNHVCPIRKANPYRRMAKALATSNHHPNLLNRQFNPAIPRKIFLTDITYLHYQNKYAYLSTIKDSCTKEIVAYRISPNLKLNFVLETLEDLIPYLTKAEEPTALIHSDQGCHYTANGFQSRVKELGLIQSMSRRGNCWDNAPKESFYGHMKDELNLNNCLTYEDVVAEIDDYMDYYNNYRGQWTLNRMHQKSIMNCYAHKKADFLFSKSA
ncbi:MAG: IS3 family transposase [Vagococcus sp.]|nr:IS3 family transposase [Vagococcus sp.]